MKPKIINTIRAQIYELLKEAICNGEYKPGQWLQEKELAEQFSVSRSPVREALHQLVSDGLLVEVPNKGVFVREFTPKDIDEIIELRILLENYAIDRLSSNLTEEASEKLTECLDMLNRDYERNDLSAYIEVDTDLHDLIIKLSGNDFLQIIYERVHILIRQFRIYSLREKPRFDESIIEHNDIVHSILEHQPEKAKEANYTHLRLARNEIIRQLEKKNLH
ncbi:MAG: GntR family transcriptional regulator [Clostridiales bacterium]|nr:GntR family transcriptional regulator [Clostridiales bacterium]